MYSRAHLLIERDFKKIQKEKELWGIKAFPLNDDNMFEWVAKIQGLKGTPWQDGVFRIYIKFDEKYNYQPPQICFHTVPFHPNVDPITGKPCISFLEDQSQWHESYSLLHVLLTMQTMLSNPELHNPVNPDAAVMYEERPAFYKEIVQDCVTASQRVEMGIGAEISEKPIPMVDLSTKKTEDEEIPSAQRVPHDMTVTKLSFEDYHIAWKGIATSKNSNKEKNEYLESLQEKPDLQKLHFGMTKDELERKLQLQTIEHQTLFYGRTKIKKDEEDRLKEAKLAEIEKMKKMYLPKRNTATPRSNYSTPMPHSQSSSKDKLISDPPQNTPRETTMGSHWENEVDDLVAWTTKLDEASL